MTVYFTSDLHLKHRYVLEKRGTTDEEIIDTINQTVKTDDELWIVGDFALATKKQVRDYRARINCETVHLVRGNHDSAPSDAFTTVTDIAKVGKKKRDGYGFILCHYPFQDWDMERFLLHGHIHSQPHEMLTSDPTLTIGTLPIMPARTHGTVGYNMRQLMEGVPRLDVGWDAWERPVSADEIMAIWNFTQIGKETE